VQRVVLAVLVAAPGVVQVREIEAVDALVLDQPEQAGQVLMIVLGHGEAHADLEPGIAAQADAGQRQVEGALHAAELVVRGAEAVEADADVVVADGADAVEHGRVDQRAVGGQRGEEAHLLRARRDLENVRPQQRLAAGKDQRRNAEGLELVHDAEHLGGAQLAGEVLVGGNRIAVLAGQVAAPDQVPDHHRAGRLSSARSVSARRFPA
jgi:hypothetical protein